MEWHSGKKKNDQRDPPVIKKQKKQLDNVIQYYTWFPIPGKYFFF